MQNFKMMVTSDQSKVVQERCKPENKPYNLGKIYLCYADNSFFWPSRDWWKMNHGEYLPELTYAQFLDKYVRLSALEETRKEISKPWVILAEPNNSDDIMEYIKVKGFKFGQASFRFGDFFSEDGKSLGNDYLYVENAGYRMIQTSELIQIIKDMYKSKENDVEIKSNPEPFTLPKNWHVVVTEENQKEVSEWMGFQVKTNIIAGMVMDGEDISKNWNPLRLVKTNDYDFGQEITTEQFRKYVLKKEEDKTFPRKMLVWDGVESSAVETMIHAYVPTIEYSWIGENDMWKNAKEVPQFIYLTPQDISEGKGVGIDPKLIKIKE